MFANIGDMYFLGMLFFFFPSPSRFVLHIHLHLARAINIVAFWLVFRL